MVHVFKLKSIRLKVIILPLILTFISIIMIITINLHSETNLPSEGWSREIQIPLLTSNSKPLFYGNEDGYQIYAYSEQGITHLTVDNSVKISNESIIDVKVPPFKPFWTEGQNVVFINDNQLILSNGQSEQSLFENVDGLAVHKDLILFWHKNKLYQVSTKDFSVTSLWETEHPIESIVINQNSPSSFLVVTTPDASHFQFNLYQVNTTGALQISPLYTLTEYTGETVKDFKFVANDQKINIIYTTYSVKQGNVIDRAYFTQMNLDQLDQEAVFQQIEIHTDSRFTIKNPKYIHLYQYNDETNILFSALSFITPKKSGVNIYEAAYRNGKWVAEKRSKTTNMSVQPIWLNKDNILWLDYIANKEYQLMGTSTDPVTIKESQAIHSADVANAISDALLSLSVSLIVIFNALVWLIPSTIFIVTLLFFDINKVEKNTPWVKHTAIFIYLLTQLLMMGKIFNNHFANIAPPYFIFPYNFIIIPILIGGLSYLIVGYGKGHDWDSIKEVIYYIGVNIWIVTIFLGPYIL